MKTKTLRQLAGDPPFIPGVLPAPLAAIRRETEKLFPQARAFVRPGFDERHGVGVNA